MSGHKRLSILICSLIKRQKQLSQLLSCLNLQVAKNVEVLVETDDGRISIGAKRNSLLYAAQGDYVAFVDDDDSVSLNYVSKILNALAMSPDCCSLTGQITHVVTVCVGRRKKHRQRVKQTFVHSIDYDHWFEKNGIYYRCPNHLNAIKRELALRVGFLEKNKDEDRDFSVRLLPLLKTEVKIEGIIYYYLAS